jgi:hypothetical protein
MVLVWFDESGCTVTKSSTMIDCRKLTKVIIENDSIRIVKTNIVKQLIQLNNLFIYSTILVLIAYNYMAILGPMQTIIRAPKFTRFPPTPMNGPIISVHRFPLTVNNLILYEVLSFC